MNDMLIVLLFLCTAIPSWCIVYFKYRELTNKTNIYSNIYKLLGTVGISACTFMALNEYTKEMKTISRKLEDIESGMNCITEKKNA